MRPMRYIIAGWAVAACAVSTAVVAFPAIADKAASQRTDAIWAAQAAEFAVERKSESVARAGLSADLTAVHINTDLETPFERDFTFAPFQSPIDRELRLEARYNLSERQCLAEAVYYEARSETRSGQLAVAEVVQNRVRSKHYPNSICGVVYQGAERRTGCQFTFTCDGSTEISPKGRHWERAQHVAALSMSGQLTPITKRATHYHTTAINPIWANSRSLRFDRQVGSHKFYRFSFRERPVMAASLSVAPPSP